MTTAKRGSVVIFGQRLLDAMVSAEAAQRALEVPGVDRSPLWNRLVARRDAALLAQSRARTRYFSARTKAAK